MSKLFPAFAALLVFALFSCQSIQKDLLLSTAETGDTGEIENTIVPLDRHADRDSLRTARQKVEELEARGIGDNHVKGLLAAWSGRLSLLEGKPLEAERLLALSRSFSPGNIQALVLSIRLQSDAEKRLSQINEALALEPASGELSIELGRVLLELRQYPEAVAAFDSAFARLDSEVYRTTYQDDRDRAWEFRNLPVISDAAARTLDKASLTWKDVLSLTSQETDLLRFITAGRNWSEEELFRRLLAGNFIPQAQRVESQEWTAEDKAAIGDTVLRSGAAWYLWHLYAEVRNDRSLLARYSSRYRTGGRDSPIQDVPVNSIFFDPILGCIERELMALPDGRNFNGSAVIRGAAFYDMLKRIQP
jgi:tetratricopeptide (TPR) repeat protein